MQNPTQVTNSSQNNSKVKSQPRDEQRFSVYKKNPRDLNKMRSSKKRRNMIAGGILMAVMVVGVFSASFLSQESQDVRQQASGYNCGTVTITVNDFELPGVEPSPQIDPLPIMFNINLAQPVYASRGGGSTISGYRVQVRSSVAHSNPRIVITDKLGSKSQQYNQNTAGFINQGLVAGKYVWQWTLSETASPPSNMTYIGSSGIKFSQIDNIGFYVDDNGGNKTLCETMNNQVGENESCLHDIDCQNPYLCLSGKCQEEAIDPSLCGSFSNQSACVQAPGGVCEWIPDPVYYCESFDKEDECALPCLWMIDSCQDPSIKDPTECVDSGNTWYNADCVGGVKEAASYCAPKISNASECSAVGGTWKNERCVCMNKHWNGFECVDKNIDWYRCEIGENGTWDSSKDTCICPEEGAVWYQSHCKLEEDLCIDDADHENWNGSTCICQDQRVWKNYECVYVNGKHQACAQDPAELGVWNPDTSTCSCSDSDYSWDGNKCVVNVSAEETACISDPNGTWIGGECKCEDDYSWDGNKCVANVSAEETACILDQNGTWIGGECKCDDGYTWTGTVCEEDLTEEQIACKNDDFGTWKIDFTNPCVDNCNATGCTPDSGPYSGCLCDGYRCWNGEVCVFTAEYTACMDQAAAEGDAEWKEFSSERADICARLEADTDFLDGVSYMSCNCTANNECWDRRVGECRAIRSDAQIICEEDEQGTWTGSECDCPTDGDIWHNLDCVPQAAIDCEDGGGEWSNGSCNCPDPDLSWNGSACVNTGNDPVLQFKLSFAGIPEVERDINGDPINIFHPEQNGRSLIVELSIKDESGDEYAQDLEVNYVETQEGADSYYKSDAVPLANFPTGQYKIFIKGPMHRKHEFCILNQTADHQCAINEFITIEQGAAYVGNQAFDFTGVPMEAGDLAIAGDQANVQDGLVNNLDHSFMVGCFTKAQDPVCVSRADLNFSGAVTNKDRDILLDTLSASWDY